MISIHFLLTPLISDFVEIQVGFLHVGCSISVRIELHLNLRTLCESAWPFTDLARMVGVSVILSPVLVENEARAFTSHKLDANGRLIHRSS